MFDYVDALNKQRAGTAGGSNALNYEAPGLTRADVLRSTRSALAGLSGAAGAAKAVSAAAKWSATAPADSLGGGGDLVDRIAGAIRKHESGGNYGIYNQTENVPLSQRARGAYQFLPSTYRGVASRFGLNGDDWSPANQDAVAKNYIKSILDANGNDPAAVAATWYVGHVPTSQSEWNAVPYPSAGNSMTVRSYADWLLNNI